MSRTDLVSSPTWIVSNGHRVVRVQGVELGSWMDRLPEYLFLATRPQPDLQKPITTNYMQTELCAKAQQWVFCLFFIRIFFMTVFPKEQPSWATRLWTLLVQDLLLCVLPCDHWCGTCSGCWNTKARMLHLSCKRLQTMLPLPAISPCSTAEAVAQQWNSLDAYEKWNKAHLTLSCLWIDSLFNPKAGVCARWLSLLTLLHIIWHFPVLISLTLSEAKYIY